MAYAIKFEQGRTFVKYTESLPFVATGQVRSQETKETPSRETSLKTRNLITHNPAK